MLCITIKMGWTHAFSVLASATSVLATLNPNHFHPDLTKKRISPEAFRTTEVQPPPQKRQEVESLFLNNQTRGMCGALIAVTIKPFAN